MTSGKRLKAGHKQMIRDMKRKQARDFISWTSRKTRKK